MSSHARARRGSDSKFQSANSPARNRGHAAAAIMAALSVEEGERREGYRHAAFRCLCGEANSQFAIRCYAACHEDAGCSDCLCCGKCLAQQVSDDGVLEAGDEIQSLLIA